MNYDRRLIEDYLPIQAISAEASREKNVRRGHICTLHLWWARRPLVACRAAVYGVLVPANRFRPANGPEEKRDSLGRANAAKFVERLCKYPGDPKVVAEAEQHILEAHAERLSQETGKKITVEDIREGRAPRPKVLDMFAGGGSIPLEALRLGCEAYALELNPVAHIIELCTLVYPQKYGKPDKTAKGSAKDGTWAGLAEEVRYWGNWVLEKVEEEIGDLYPPIPDPKAAKVKQVLGEPQLEMSGRDFKSSKQQSLAAELPSCHLTPIAYLWTRTVRCKKPSCGATVPLVRQTWLCKKRGHYVALKMIAPKGHLPAASAAQAGKRVRFEVVEAASEEGLGFDPAAFSKGGNATCPFCGTVADSDYVKTEGCAGRMGQQMMAVVCTRPGRQGKIYLSADRLPGFVPGEEAIRLRIEALCARTGLTVPNEMLVEKLTDQIPHYGMGTFRILFTPRQMLSLLTLVAELHAAEAEMRQQDYEEERTKCLISYAGFILDKISTRSNTLCPWDSKKLLTVQVFGRQALPMLWDFSESNPFGGASGGSEEALEGLVRAIGCCLNAALAATLHRGSATALPWSDGSFDAVITDPPYYDNIQYAALSDFFYVWLKRTVGHLYPEHFATEISPKKNEAVASPWRHKSKAASRQAYEAMMAQSFAEAHRVLKADGQMTVVYAHKTTLGWATLVNALRQAGFNVTEAWPLDTEGYRLVALDSAALASSIFLVARKREAIEAGRYEEEVRPELEQIVRERVETLWEMGITGADLVIAAVGAGLRAFTRFAKVEYANGEEVPTERFLTEVEGVVLEMLLEKIFGVPRSGIAAVDGPSRFYVLWRYTYKAGELEAGEAIVFTYGQPVELDGTNGLSTGSRALVEKKKGKYRLRDFTERGADEKLGLSDHEGRPAPLIDTLHRILWLIENEPRNLNRFLDEVRPDQERLRLVAQALAGAGLKGKAEESKPLISTTSAEQTALDKLLSNWRTLIDQRLSLEEDRTGQRRLQY